MDSDQKYWLSYFEDKYDRYHRFTEYGGVSVFAEKIAEVAAHIIFWASPYGCANGCPGSSEGFHTFSCLKASRGA